jgi:hypothetical protein
VICTELAKASRSGYSSRVCSAAKKLLSIPAGGTVITATTQITYDTQGHCSRGLRSRMSSLWGIHAIYKEC